MKVICITKEHDEFTYKKWYEIYSFYGSSDHSGVIIDDNNRSRFYPIYLDGIEIDTEMFLTGKEWRESKINEILL